MRGKKCTIFCNGFVTYSSKLLGAVGGAGSAIISSPSLGSKSWLTCTQHPGISFLREDVKTWAIDRKSHPKFHQGVCMHAYIHTYIHAFNRKIASSKRVSHELYLVDHDKNNGLESSD
jgi:hypothetical protein